MSASGRGFGVPITNVGSRLGFSESGLAGGSGIVTDTSRGSTGLLFLAMALLIVFVWLILGCSPRLLREFGTGSRSWPQRPMWSDPALGFSGLAFAGLILAILLQQKKPTRSGRRATMRPVLITLLALFAAFQTALGTSVAYAQWVIYDSFSGSSIAPERWSGFEIGGGSASPNTEINRDILFGSLHEKLVGYGSATSNTGAPSHGAGIGVTNPGPIIGLTARVTVVKATAGGCAANPTAARARAQVVGAFFNDGSSTGAGDRTGDILAGIQKQLDSVTGARIAAFISRCANAACTNIPGVSSQFFVTTWHAFQPHILRVEWAPNDDKFIFTVNPDARGEEIVELAYVFSDSSPPALDFKNLSLNHTTPNCLGDRQKALMDVFYDDAQVLLSALPEPPPPPPPPPPLCAEFGQLCSLDSECCNDVPCTSGRCRFP